MSIEDEPGHAAYAAAIAGVANTVSTPTPAIIAMDTGEYARRLRDGTLPDTPPQGLPAPAPLVPSEPAGDPESPSAVRQHEIEMTLLLTKINQELPDALSALQRAKDHVRRLRLEKAGAERLLATHHRLNNPRRRKVSQ